MIRFIFFSLAIYILASCQNLTSEVEAIQKINKDSASMQYSYDVEILYSDSAILKAKLNTPYLIRKTNYNSYSEMPEGLHIDFFTPAKEVESSIDAQYGKDDESQKLVTLRNKVKVINTKNEMLETEELFWDKKAKRLYSNQFVTITTPDKVIYGNGFESDENFNTYKIFNIKGTVQVQDF
jgi:LPS export ABC transporter protein LptC